jgi:hypothetical protein
MWGFIGGKSNLSRVVVSLSLMRKPAGRGAIAPAGRIKLGFELIQIDLQPHIEVGIAIIGVKAGEGRIPGLACKISDEAW